VKRGLGKSGGWGSGPSLRGRLLAAISQQDTATATATSASSAVMISAKMNPIIDTHTGLFLSAVTASKINKYMSQSNSAIMTSKDPRGSLKNFRQKLKLIKTFQSYQTERNHRPIKTFHVFCYKHKTKKASKNGTLNKTL
jgi:hypothetical protein